MQRTTKISLIAKFCSEISGYQGWAVNFFKDSLIVESFDPRRRSCKESIEIPYEEIDYLSVEDIYNRLEKFFE